MDIGSAQIERLRSEGYLIVEGFLSRQELDEIRSALFERFPTPDSYFADPAKYHWLLAHPFGGFVEFPFWSDSLNFVAVHANLMDFAERVLETRDIRLFKSNLWAKYGGASDYEQPHHRDYGDHNLVVPTERPEFDQLGIILYYSDVTPENGPTCVVSRQDSSQIPDWETSCPRAEHPELYLRERPVTARAGSVLAFSLRTLHRASRLTSPTASRFSHIMGFQASASEWGGFRCWPSAGKQPELARFIERAAPRQRELFGFPIPGHRYWSPTTIEQVQRRYPRMDMGPYRYALDHGRDSPRWPVIKHPHELA